MKDWAQLSPAERQRVHQGYQAAQRVSAAERQAKWERYQALSPERRQALQERAAARRRPRQRRPRHRDRPARRAWTRKPCCRAAFHERAGSAGTAPARAHGLRALRGPRASKHQLNEG